MARSGVEDQVVLVTGGGRGVGRAIARTLAHAGALVAVAARSEAQLDETVAVIAEEGGRALALTADVTDQASAQEVVKQTERKLGPIDLLVNNAGTCRAIGPLWEVEANVWWQDVENNVLSTFVCARSVLPSMIERGRGRIINVSSYAAARPTPNISAYGAAKAALLHITNSLASETKAYGVAVFAITPGTVRTAMTESMTESSAGRRWLPAIPPERWLPPERAGELVLFLASGEADRLSGRFFHVLDDVPALVRLAEQLERDDLYVLRLRK